MIQISPSDILQADVTIIAGILILLTISEVFRSRSNIQLWRELRVVIAVTPAFFAVSAGLLLAGSVIPWFDQTITIQSSTGFIIGGLAYIAIAVVVLMIIAKRQPQT